MKESFRKNIKNITTGVLTTVGTLIPQTEGINSSDLIRRDKEIIKKEQATNTTTENQAVIANIKPEQFILNQIDKIKEIVLNNKYEQVFHNPYLAYALYYSQPFLDEVSNSKNQHDVSERIIGSITNFITPEFRRNAIIFIEKQTKEKENLQNKKISTNQNLPLKEFSFGFGKNHKDAIDLFTKESSLAYSIEGGIVLVADKNWQLNNELSSSSMKGGNTVVIFNYLNKEFYRYAHLDKVNVSSGELIMSGQELGTVGHTGKEASISGHGQHLHFEINKYLNSENVNQLLTVNDLKNRLRRLKHII